MPNPPSSLLPHMSECHFLLGGGSGSAGCGRDAMHRVSTMCVSTHCVYIDCRTGAIHRVSADDAQTAAMTLHPEGVILAFQH